MKDGDSEIMFDEEFPRDGSIIWDIKKELKHA
jgi:hypothetical protein